MKNIAINLKSIGYNLTILGDYDYLFTLMVEIESLCSAQAGKHNFRWDVYVAMLRHDLIPQYKSFLKNPSSRNDKNEAWKDFITYSIMYFFADAFFYNKPINLVHIDSFEKAITKGIYANLTDGDKPDLIEGIDYINYVRV